MEQKKQFSTSRNAITKRSLYTADNIQVKIAFYIRSRTSFVTTVLTRHQSSEISLSGKKNLKEGVISFLESAFCFCDSYCAWTLVTSGMGGGGGSMVRDICFANCNLLQEISQYFVVRFCELEKKKQKLLGVFVSTFGGNNK